MAERAIERFISTPDGSLRQWTRRADGSPRTWLLPTLTPLVLQRHLASGAHRAFGMPSFEERNTIMANAIADVTSVSIARAINNPHAIPQLRSVLAQAVHEAGQPFDPERSIPAGDASRQARPIALRNLNAVMQACGLADADMRGVLEIVDIAHIVPLAARQLGVAIPHYSRDELAQVLLENMKPTDAFRAQAEKVFGTRQLTTPEEERLSVLLRLSHATWMICKVHEAAMKGDEMIMSGNEQVNPYDVMVRQQYERHLTEGQSPEVALVLSAWNMYKDCRRSTGDSLALMLPQ